MAYQQHVYFVSLGCPKNRVDSEVMLGHLQQAGYGLASKPDTADVIVVNTCGFIDAAKEESIDTIIEMGGYKTSGMCKKLVVTGCLSQRYAPDLAQSMPEVDHFLGTGNFETIAHVLEHGTDDRREKVVAPHARLSGRHALVPFKHAYDPTADKPVHIPDPDFTITSHSPRVATQPIFSSYLKISEGCSNTCAFCIIPKLRGPQRSRPINDVVAEAARLILAGACELNLIAQDLCAYGNDLQPRAHLSDLLRALNALGAGMARPLWIRCLYAYPKGLTTDVMDALRDCEHVVPYLDMPLQHIADPLLKSMRRGAGGAATRKLIDTLRQRVPNLVLRTTFITGLPGETEAHFQELHDFIAQTRFERLGVFAYSREEDTPAGMMDDQVSKDIAEMRRDIIMQTQMAISTEQQEAMLGQTIDVLVEGICEESELLLQGRHAGQAPDIDGLTYITQGSAKPGDIVRVHIEEAGAYDLAGPIAAH